MYKDIIRPLLEKPRFIHSVNVSNMAKKLAGIYGEDQEKAAVAGILHDIMKNTSQDKQLKMLNDYGIYLTPLEKLSPKLWHAILGAEYIKSELGVEDQEIVNAVRYHTTARENMTKLEKIIFVSDFISEDRTYTGVEKIRSVAFEDIDYAVFEGLSFSIESLLRKKCTIHPDTIGAYNEILTK